MKKYFFLPIFLILLFFNKNVSQSHSINDEESLKLFEQAIENWIVQNPKKIREVLKKLEADEKINEENKTFKMLSNNSLDPYIGPFESEITIYEFFDYNCGYCKSLNTTLMGLVNNYKNIKIVFKELPILSQSSIDAAFFALAAKNQNLYIEYHNKIMQYKGRLTEQTLIRFAEEIGLDIEKIKNDMLNEEIKSIIEKNRILAKRLNINGTPTLIIGKRIIPGAVSEKQLIDYIEQARNINS